MLVVAPACLCEFQNRRNLHVREIQPERPIHIHQQLLEDGLEKSALVGLDLRHAPVATPWSWTGPSEAGPRSTARYVV